MPKLRCTSNFSWKLYILVLTHDRITDVSNKGKDRNFENKLISFSLKFLDCTVRILCVCVRARV